MDKLEININFFSNYKPIKKLTKSDFQGLESLFNIFNTDGDDKLSDKEIHDIFAQIALSAAVNKKDSRQNNNSIFDSDEAEHFILNNKSSQGNILKDLGVTISQVFEFLKIIESNSIQEEVDPGEDFEKIIEKEDIDNTTIERANKFKNIPERGENQFTDEERIQLANLTDEEIDKAKKFFYIESRTTQFSADDIVMLATECGGKFQVKKENYQRLDEFLTLKNSAGEELSGEDIIKLMSISSDKIDSAIQLLRLENRKENPLSVQDIVNILDCDSEELLNTVIQNPQTTDFKKTRSIAATFVSYRDSATNITYRYIAGQQYPEEITEEAIDDNTFKRIVKNKNLNIVQTLIFDKEDSNNPIRIETQHLSSNGDVEYTEVMEQGINPGTPDIYTIDSAGNKTYIQQAVADEQTGGHKIIKHFTDDKGNTTEFSYSIANENEFSLDYTITDKNGDKVFERYQTLKKISNNVYEFTKDGKNYNLESQDDKIVITDKTTNETYEIKYADYIDVNDNPDMFKQNILQIPADILIFISKNPLSLSYGTKTRDNQGLCRAENKAIDIGTITKTNSEQELNAAFMTIIIHELGHYIDNPNLSEDNNDILSMNEDFLRIYREELEEFNRNHTSEEQMIMMQFNGIGYQNKSHETQLKRSASESFAEFNMLANTNSKSWTSSRSYYLQRYFPKTLARAQELLNARIND